jgi:hypothetical protein
MKQQRRWGPWMSEPRQQGEGLQHAHEQDADDIALEEGLAVVFAVLISSGGMGVERRSSRLEPYGAGSLVSMWVKVRARVRTGTHTKVMKLATREQTPATMMTARAKRSPVPPWPYSEETVGSMVAVLREPAATGEANDDWRETNDVWRR